MTYKDVSGDQMSISKRRKANKKNLPYDICSAGHPITASNLVKGTDRGCIICQITSRWSGTKWGALRDARISEIADRAQAEADALLAAVRGKEKAA